MSEPRDLRDLVGEDVPKTELEALRRVDELLRSVPAPPARVPPSLTRSVAGLPLGGRRFAPRRVVAAVALAAALSALFFGLGRWTSGECAHYRLTVPMHATGNALGAAALIKVGERDARTGNWTLALEVSGLPKLHEGEYYVLWLAKDGEYAATCGTFNVGAGTTTVRMTVSYRLDDYDAWVISKHGEKPPWLLRAAIST